MFSNKSQLKKADFYQLTSSLNNDMGKVKEAIEKLENNQYKENDKLNRLVTFKLRFTVRCAKLLFLMPNKFALIERIEEISLLDKHTVKVVLTPIYVIIFTFLFSFLFQVFVLGSVNIPFPYLNL